MNKQNNRLSRKTSNDRAHGVSAFRTYTLAACLTLSGISPALAQPGAQLTVYDLDGNESGLVGAPDDYTDLVYSPDGSRIAAATISFPSQNSSLLIIDVETGETMLIAEGVSGDTVGQPVWSPDGRELAYLTLNDNQSEIYRRAADGDGNGELLYSVEREDILLGDWSQDGRLVFVSIDRFADESRLYLLDMPSGSEPILLAEFDHPVLDPRFSPDGRYLSYLDNLGALFVTRAVPQADGAQETWQLRPGSASRSPFAPPVFGFWDVDDPVFYRIEVSQGVRVLATPVDTTGDFEFGEVREVMTLPISIVTSTATLSRDGEQLLIAADPPRRMSVVDADGNEVASVGVPIRFLEHAFSPDFSRVAAATTELRADDATWDLYVVDAESGDAALIGVSESRGGSTPVWSPDGTEVAFVALEGSRYNVYRRRIDAESSGNGELVYSHLGGPIALGDWSEDGRFIVFSSGRNAPVSRLQVIDLESDREPIVVAEDTDQPMGSPRFSTDGRYLAYVRGTDEASLHVTRATPVTDGHHQAWQLTTGDIASAGFWDSDDAVLYYLDGEQRVMALSVDTSGAFEFGEPHQVMRLPEDAVESSFTMRRDGERMLFERQPLEQRFRLPSTQIAVLDRNGDEIARFGEPGLYDRPTFSPDGSQILATRRDPDNPFAGNVALWIFDAASGEAMQITAEDSGFEGSNPVWMADGEYIAYSVNSGMGRGDDGSWIYRMRADGQGEAEPLFRTELGVVRLNLTDVSSDDEYLLFDSFGVAYAVPLTGDDPLARTGIDALRGEFEFGSAHFSPDMRVVAYTYNEDETPEVYVSRFDAEAGTASDGERHQVSDGVVAPSGFAGSSGLNLPMAWRADGQELYFSARGQVMAVSVSTEPMLETGEPRPLFDSARQLQDVSPDGQRFLFVVPALDTDETEPNRFAER